MSKPLTRMISWAHELFAEIVRPGDLAVDLTAGNGCDTLILARLVGESGQVVAFDIQATAVENTRQRLLQAGFSARSYDRKISLPRQAGIDLVWAGHEHLVDYLPGSPRVVVANLGYLPGGDTSLTTRCESTLAALEQAAELLADGGRLVVVVYIGHPGGATEGEAVSRFFAELDDSSFQVLQLQAVNRPQAPYLLVAEKKMTGRLASGADGTYREEIRK